MAKKPVLSKAVRAYFAERGKIGGEARAASLSAKRRSEIASQAAKARWAKHRRSTRILKAP